MSTKNIAAFTPQTKASVPIVASAGLYYGFGAFVYSGNETLASSGGPVVWTPSNKS